MQRGLAPGTGGLRAEFLISLAEKLEEHHMELLESFGMRYLEGSLPSWFYRVAQTVTTVPIYKNSQKESVRPLGIKNQMIRVFHQEVVRQNKQQLTEYLEPQQLALSEAGGGKLVHSVRMLMEERRDYVVVKVDMRNAFNEVSRASIIEALEREPSLQHLSWFAAAVLAAPTPLEHGGVVWGEAHEGEAQGDPKASPFFCVAWHENVREIDAAVASVGGIARFGMDDGYVVGPPSVVFPAIEKFGKDVD